MIEKPNETLPEVLKKMDKDQLVKLGAKGGSGFIAIMTAGAMLERMDEINETCYEQMLKRYYAAQKRLNDALDKPATYNAYVKDVVTKAQKDNRKDISVSADGYDRFVAGWTKGIMTAYRMYYTAKEHLDGFVEVKKRKVREKYPSMEYDEPSMILLMDGSELGKLWMPSEVGKDVEDDDDDIE